MKTAEKYSTYTTKNHASFAEKALEVINKTHFFINVVSLIVGKITLLTGLVYLIKTFVLE